MIRDAGVWTETFHVRTYESDPQGRASIQTLCNYFQEAAGLHARSYGVAIDDLLELGLTWVLARLRMQVDAFPVWGDTVEVETWPAGVQGLFATRDVLFFQAGGSGRRLLAQGTSAWLVIDAARKRPVRVPPIISEIRLPERPRALDASFGKLTVPDADGHARRFRVRYSDLDVNQHVNNVRYAEWAVESVPDGVLTGCLLREIEMHFLAETTLGDAVLAHAYPDDGAAAPTFTHRLVREADERDVALARTWWTAEEAGTP